MIQIGQIYRDTYDHGFGKDNLRTIRIVGQESDGRWIAETLTGVDGGTPTPRQVARKNRLSEKTLIASYVLVQPRRKDA